jgi:peroxiredoxin
LPVLDRLARRFAEQGVVVLAIHAEQGYDQYRDHLDTCSYAHMRIARDSSGDIFKAYQVRAIPATYVIDPQGVIRYVHMGYGSGMEDALAGEIKSLLP